MSVEKGMVKCINCKHGAFMQWFNNPIICNCHIFDEKFVAESRRICTEYIKSAGTHKIEHYDHY